MDTKILEKLIKDHLPDYADKFFHEDYKEENLQAVADQCTRLESELKVVREKKGKSAFFDMLDGVLNDLSFKSGHPETSYRSHEMTRQAATALYLQIIAFWSDIIEEYRQAGEQIIEEAEKEATSELEKLKAEKYHILEELNDKELIRKERNEALEEYQRMPWGKNCHYTGANRNQLIERLAFLQFQYLTGLNRTAPNTYQKAKIRMNCVRYLQIKYLNSLINPENPMGDVEPKSLKSLLFGSVGSLEKIEKSMEKYKTRGNRTSICLALSDTLIDKGWVSKSVISADDLALIIDKHFFPDAEKPIGGKSRRLKRKGESGELKDDYKAAKDHFKNL